MEFVFIAIGLLSGFFIGLFWGRGRGAEWKTRFEAQQQLLAEQKRDAEQDLARQQALSDKHLQETVDALKSSFETQKEDLAAQYEKILQEKESAHATMVASLEKQYRDAEEALQKRFDETISKTVSQLQNSADEMLKQRQREFAESSNHNLGQLVSPLKEAMDKMKEAMDSNSQKQSEIGVEMRTNLSQIVAQSQAAKESADELTRVLRHSNQAQGSFGEIVLEELLSSQGLTRGIHFDTQTTLATDADDAGRLRPDVILHLDQEREVIIDSKVSLSAFMDYVNAPNEALKKEALARHINSIEQHVKELTKKDYSRYVRAPKVCMDYVIMFMPHSAALWTALNAKPELWRKAMEKNVYIADEQTLFAALKIIQLTWQQIRQAENHEKVFDLANTMIERVGLFMEHYKKIGSALESAQKAYNSGNAKLEDKKQSIPQTARQLIKLGARQSDKHPLPPEPKQLLDEADENISCENV